MSDIYRKCTRFLTQEFQKKRLDYPLPDPSGAQGRVKLYGNHHGFTEGACKRCDKPFDITFNRRAPCDFHTERSKRYRGRQHPYGCCGGSFGSRGCKSATSHVYKGNIYLDVEGFVRTEARDPPEGGDHGVYAMDTESIHTVKGIEICKVTVIDSNRKVVYDEYCLPTTEIVDYNTIWSGITAQDLEGVTKTFSEMRDELLQMFSRDTILIGHGLGSDLMLLKILHEKVIDTLILYPHPRGPPLLQSLKDTARKELGRVIQTGNGHDSKEDAEVAMELVLKKIR